MFKLFFKKVFFLKQGSAKILASAQTNYLYQTLDSCRCNHDDLDQGCMEREANDHNRIEMAAAVPDSTRQLHTDRQYSRVPDNTRVQDSIRKKTDGIRQYQTVSNSTRQYKTAPDSARQYQIVPDSTK